MQYRPIIVKKPNQNIRGHIRSERAFQKKSRDTHKTQHDCRGRKRMKVSEQINDGTSTPAAGATQAVQVDDLIASISTLDYIDIDYVRTPDIKDTFSSS
ncbi:hypothetical protein EVAR_23990_1 [Eumeta japonica]|uniref:Uncharacterized protein n=1 Tax=Eumeta variegata TaxID=151549 RepID=A0A4C1V1A9_EUMVA|nr:hypothetical protein EVAR_23990_1 [Eumeta japonica]